MALAFTGGDADVVNVGSAPSLDTLTARTYLVWCYPTAIANNRQLLQKGLDSLADAARLEFRDTGVFRIYVPRGGGVARADVATSTLTTDKWWCLAGVYDESATAPKLYYGDPVAPMKEPASYSFQTASSGVTSADGNIDLKIGGNASTTSMAGSIAVAAMFNRVLTLAEIESWRLDPRPLSGCVGLWRLGTTGLGIQYDYSGFGNHGVVTGATLALDPPIQTRTAEKPFERYRRIWPVGAIVPVIQRNIKVGMF